MEFEKINWSNGVLDRIKQYYSIKSDVDLSVFLNISQPRLSQWRKRGTLDVLHVITICYNTNIDFNWLFTGKLDGGLIDNNTINELNLLKDENMRLKITIEALQDRLLSHQKFQNVFNMPKKYKPELS